VPILALSGMEGRISEKEPAVWPDRVSGRTVA